MSDYADGLNALDGMLTDARLHVALILADPASTTGLEEATLNVIEKDLRLLGGLVGSLIVSDEVSEEKPTTDDRADLTTDWCSTCIRQTSHRTAPGSPVAVCVVCGSQAYMPPMPSRLLSVVRGGAA